MASMANPQRYQRFSLSMYAIYHTMEKELDETSVSAPQLFRIWQKHGDKLRRRNAIAIDLSHCSVDVMNLDRHLEKHLEASPATANYVQAIEQAGRLDRETQNATLTGHLYCRYFADLFGGQMLGSPYQYALQLPESPRFYEFDFSQCSRRELIEDLYKELNHTGDTLQDETKRTMVVQEAYKAFEHNIAVYTEEPVSLEALRGGWNIGSGVVNKVFSQR